MSESGLSTAQQFEVLRALSRTVLQPSDMRISGINEYDFAAMERLRSHISGLVNAGLVEAVYEDRAVGQGPAKHTKSIHAGFRLILRGALVRQELAEKLGTGNYE